MDFFPWVDSYDESFARIADLIPPELDEHSWMFNGNNKPLGEVFPEDLVFDLSRDGGKKLGDFIPNTDNMLIVSDRLKEILEQRSSDFEFYRISIRNHKKRIEKKQYYLAHLLLSVPCLDTDESEYKKSAMDEDQMLRVSRLVLDTSKIPEGKKILRLGEMKKLILVRRDLAVEIYREHECRGMLFQKIELYGEEFRDDD